MTDRQPVEVLDNGAIRYGVYNSDGTLDRYEYIKNEDGATVEGTLINKANLLTDTTALAYGLDSTAVPDDVLAQLVTGYNKYGYLLTIKYSDGTVASRIVVSGITTLDGSTPTTDANGQVFGISSNNSVTIGITGYFDFTDVSKSITSTGIITASTITLVNSASVGTIATSKTYKVSRSLTVDLHLIGGGYDGNAGNGDPLCAGGNSGKAYYIADTDVAVGSYSAVVGATNGGASSFLSKSSTSGTFGAGGELYGEDGAGGGVSPISSSLIYGGGGGGGGLFTTYGGDTTYQPGSGSNGGGDGGAITTTTAGDGENATEYGAGGGGGALVAIGGVSGSGGLGKAGAIFYRWELQA